MDINSEFLDEVEVKIDSLPEEDVMKAVEESSFFIESVSDKEIAKEFLFEDYVYVIGFLKALGYEEVPVSTWCDECEDEVETIADSDTFKWTCPVCGHINRH